MQLIVKFIVFLWGITRPLRNYLHTGKCCYYPSCSDYFLQAVNKHGFLSGFSLGVLRICRCHPFSKGGHDPVPSNILGLTQILILSAGKCLGRETSCVLLSEAKHFLPKLGLSSLMRKSWIYEIDCKRRLANNVFGGKKWI